VGWSVHLASLIMTPSSRTFDTIERKATWIVTWKGLKSGPNHIQQGQVQGAALGSEQSQIFVQDMFDDDSGRTSFLSTLPSKTPWITARMRDKLTLGTVAATEELVNLGNFCIKFWGKRKIKSNKHIWFCGRWPGDKPLQNSVKIPHGKNIQLIVNTSRSVWRKRNYIISSTTMLT